MLSPEMMGRLSQRLLSDEMKGRLNIFILKMLVMVSMLLDFILRRFIWELDCLCGFMNRT